jgi:hypothetical protein
MVAVSTATASIRDMRQLDQPSTLDDRIHRSSTMP